MRTALAAATLILALWALPAQALSLDGNCLMLAKNPQGKIEAVADAAQVNSAISASPFRPLRAPDGYTGASILCTRGDFMPGGNDYRVLQLGYSLLIKSPFNNTSRAGALELVNGTIQFRLYPGTTLSSDETARLKTAIDTLQAVYDASPDTPKPAK